MSPSVDQATPASRDGTVVVLSAVLRPGNVWYVSLQLPDWSIVRVAVPSSLASLAAVQVVAHVVSALYGTEALGT
jgi:hypothetical protein